jgi:hypothetical protein
VLKPAIIAAAVLAAGPFAAPANAEGMAVRAAADKIVCKRFVPVGTLARAKRTCKTQREWQMERDTARAEGGRLTEQMSGEREVAAARPPGAPNP